MREEWLRIFQFSESNDLSFFLSLLFNLFNRRVHGEFEITQWWLLALRRFRPIEDLIAVEGVAAVEAAAGILALHCHRGRAVRLVKHVYKQQNVVKLCNQFALEPLRPIIIPILLPVTPELLTKKFCNFWYCSSSGLLVMNWKKISTRVSLTKRFFSFGNGG